MESSAVSQRLALICLVLAVPLLIGADEAGDGDEVAAAAVAYAEGFRGTFDRDPAEATAMGLVARDLANLTAVATLQVADVDDRFRTTGDSRQIDQSLVMTDLWWVLLRSAGGNEIVVSVHWPDGAKAPQGVGLNWAPAAEFSDALAAVGDPSPQLVWIPEDAPLLIGNGARGPVAMPIANQTLRARLQMEPGPRTVAGYTSEVRDRLSRLSAVPGNQDVGAGSGAGSPDDSGGPSPLAILAGPLAVIAAVILLSNRQRGKAPPRRHRANPGT